MTAAERRRRNQAKADMENVQSQALFGSSTLNCDLLKQLASDISFSQFYIISLAVPVLLGRDFILKTRMTLGPNYFSFDARPDHCWPFENPVSEQDAGVVDALLQSLFNEVSSTSDSFLNEDKVQHSEFHLFVDASHLALGAVLNHKIDGKFVPVAYASRTLNPHEQKLSSYKLECMACTWAIEKFKEFIQVMPFHLYTDNGALTWLFSHPKQLGKIGCMVLKLSTYKFTVHHVKGHINKPADCLSRVTFNQPSLESGISCFLHNIPLSFVYIRAHQKQDAFCQDLKKLSKLSVLKVNRRYYALKDGILCTKLTKSKTYRIVAPVVIRPMLLNYFH
ncbi:hypothetical protein J437_LFUL017962 [Ladona fulva]|uniref:Reverse transcriptase RNase H-like domain-containing protein n=1 Tax=Ladona fulva TaxID=123851 RepID=A0A8K0KQ02_LADFU|nr:hypothetical protein J437_LFUL017962 [Ladona fulva]